MKRFSHINISCHIKRKKDDISILHLTNDDCGLFINNVDEGLYRIRIKIPKIVMYPESYYVYLWIGIHYVETFSEGNLMSFNVHKGSISKRVGKFDASMGVYHSDSLWEFYREDR